MGGLQYDHDDSDSNMLISGYVDGITFDGGDRSFGYAHWVAKKRNLEIIEIKATSGNASTYFEFEEISIEEQVDLYERGFWAEINRCTEHINKGSNN